MSEKILISMSNRDIFFNFSGSQFLKLSIFHVVYFCSQYHFCCGKLIFYRSQDPFFVLRAIDLTAKHETSNSSEGCSTFGLEAGQYEVNEVLKCHERAELKRSTRRMKAKRLQEESRIKVLEEALKLVNEKILKVDQYL
ncbi:uncharacterized protein LOC136025084 [Artemia franciscana]|uniref:uncharacterized protein LOC136025084 n=1 Tax=Artemia franciscana TaxID=6661 RepID=UPI0032DB67FE